MVGVGWEGRGLKQAAYTESPAKKQRMSGRMLVPSSLSLFDTAQAPQPEQRSSSQLIGLSHTVMQQPRGPSPSWVSQAVK